MNQELLLKQELYQERMMKLQVQAQLIQHQFEDARKEYAQIQELIASETKTDGTPEPEVEVGTGE